MKQVKQVRHVLKPVIQVWSGLKLVNLVRYVLKQVRQVWSGLNLVNLVRYAFETGQSSVIWFETSQSSTRCFWNRSVKYDIFFFCLVQEKAMQISDFSKVHRVSCKQKNGTDC